MQEGGGDQLGHHHLPALGPIVTEHTWRTTECSAMVSALAHVFSGGVSCVMNSFDSTSSDGVSYVRNSVDSISSCPSASAARSWTGQEREKQHMDFQFLDVVPKRLQPSPAAPLSSAQAVPGNLGNYGTIQERIRSALCHLQIFFQFWAPVAIGGQSFLTTTDQPYWCDYFNENLYRYREKSSAHYYSIDPGKEDQRGPPGRVFLQRTPEFSPNVKYYSTKEYFLRDYALFCGVKGYCALPVFESLGEHCVGVLEILPSSIEDEIWKTNEQVLEAFLAVNLKSPKLYFHRCAELYSDRFPPRAEIKRVLNAVCKSHKFPVVRVWAPCTCTYPDTATCGGSQKIRGSESDSQCRENSLREVTRLCVYEDDGNWDCAEEIYSFRRIWISLQEGQGLVGKAFSSRKSCFCIDIARLSIIDYPFVHYALDSDLMSCFVIHLRSIDPRFDCYILEVFLKEMCYEDLLASLKSLLSTVAQLLQNFKVAAEGQEEQREKESSPEVNLFPRDDDNVVYFQISRSRGTSNEASENEGDQAQLHLSKDVENINRSDAGREERAVIVSNSNKKEGGIELEGKRGDGITYELVKQHFGRNLVDAARSLQVSRSTLKRKCRKLGISRWPSHKRTHVDSVDEERCGQCSATLVKSTAAPEKATTSADTAMQEKNSMTIKATYGDHIIKFLLSFSSGIEDLKSEVAKRLKVESYIIKYKDEEGDWVLMACNDDLHYCMQSQKALGKTTIQLLMIELASIE